MNKEYICEDFNTGKKYKRHKPSFMFCECPECPQGSHKSCERCLEFIN